jgi:exo-1,4-beta-D-glucosaminidase
MLRTALLLLLLLASTCLVAGQSSSFLTNFAVQSSSKVGAQGSGPSISSLSYDTASWYGPVQVPCTVIACLLQANAFGPNFDPFYAENYGVVNNTALYQVPWWYRTVFARPVLPVPNSSRVLLTLTGINYRADVWLNGRLLANSTDLVGAFRYFDIDLTSYLSGPENVLAIMIYPSFNSVFINNSTDLAITYVDWSPSPPDNSMGIWRDVLLQVLAGPVSVRYPAVDTVLSGSPGRSHSPLELSKFVSC